LTLAEVVIGLIVFAIMAAAVASSMLQSQKISQANIMDNTAFTVAQGYLEQIKSLSYSKLKYIAANPSVEALPTKSINYATAIDTEYESATEEEAEDEEFIIQVDDPLWLDQANIKTVLLDLQQRDNGSFNELTMDLSITPTLNDISASEGRKVIEITLDFTYSSIMGSGSMTRQGSVRGLKIELSQF